MPVLWLCGRSMNYVPFTWNFPLWDAVNALFRPHSWGLFLDPLACCSLIHRPSLLSLIVTGLRDDRKVFLCYGGDEVTLHNGPVSVCSLLRSVELQSSERWHPAGVLLAEDVSHRPQEEKHVNTRFYIQSAAHLHVVFSFWIIHVEK